MQEETETNVVVKTIAVEEETIETAVVERAEHLESKADLPKVLERKPLPLELILAIASKTTTNQKTKIKAVENLLLFLFLKSLQIMFYYVIIFSQH